jgi:PIN domain nuclease of toxin-antitoxin system
MSREDIGLVDISIWEAGRIHQQGKLTSGDPGAWFAKACSHITLISITPTLTLIEQSLDWEHRDPADRLIVSAALMHSLPLLTKDKTIRDFKGVKILR